MEVCIYDTKIRKDEITLRWLGSAVANVFFYHGTVVKVNSRCCNTILISYKLIPYHEQQLYNHNLKTVH